MRIARSISVIVPVKDGERYLGELLHAVLAQHDAAPAGLDVLVIDSGSTDRSIMIARTAGVRVMEIKPADFGHGRTRNIGAQQTAGDIIVFLTQDATPVPGWLTAIQAGFDLAEDVGAVYGPHLRRPDTSPMIARELEAFFSGHSSGTGASTVHRGEDNLFLSNVNAAYRRDCWNAIRFPDVSYAEDQGFARSMLAAGWAKAFVPDAAVLHAHDYSPRQFAQRYFDEYRGLRQTTGHVEGFGVRAWYREIRSVVAADRTWMLNQNFDQRSFRRWTIRSVVHHSARKLFSAMGARAHRLPLSVQRTISLEGTAIEHIRGGPEQPSRLVSGKIVQPSAKRDYDAVRIYAHDGAAPLIHPLAGQESGRPLHVACVIPPFSRGSGGHASIFQIMSRLEDAGHTVTYWISPPYHHLGSHPESRIRRHIRDWFAPINGPVFKGFHRWYGADVVVATGWQTAHCAVLLENVRARAHLVHDNESEFYATSVHSRWAEETHRLGMHAICSSPWLADMMRERYGATVSTFDFGVDHDIYRPTGAGRRADTVVLYGRASTPRRAVPLAIMALHELRKRRPDLRILSFGNPKQIDLTVPYEHLGVLDPKQLAQVYNEGTVGLVLSLTNYSLIPQEMLACGMPCVDLAGISAEGIFGADGPVALSPFDPIAMAGVLDRLMTDRAEWERRSTAGIKFVKGRTWDVAARQVETGLREAIRLRTP